MADQPSDEQKTTTPPRTQTNTKTATPQATGEEPTPGGVHRPGRPPGEFVDNGPVSMPVTRTR